MRGWRPSMSLAGSRVSMTVESGIRLGSGIWTMIPATCGSAVQALDLGPQRRRDARPGISTSRPSMPTFAHERRIWLR